MAFSRRGLTLLELTVVMMIVAAVMATALPIVGTLQKRLLENRARTDLISLTRAAETFAEETGRVPESIDVLLNASVATRAHLSGVETLDTNGHPVDPWGSAYLLEKTGEFAIQFRSLGLDGKMGEESDAYRDKGNKRGSEDLVAIPNLHPAMRRNTVEKIHALQNAISDYNAVFLPDSPLPTTSSSDIVSRLLSTGFLLGSVSDWSTDAWGEPFAFHGHPISTVDSIGAKLVAQDAGEDLDFGGSLEPDSESSDED